MNKTQSGSRIAIIYALSLLISGVFLLNCSNTSGLEEPDESPALTKNGAELSQKDTTQQKKKDEIIRDNLRIVLRTIIEEDHKSDKDHHGQDHEEHHKQKDDRHNRHHEDSDSEALDIEQIYLSFGRIEVLTPSQGWTIIQAKPGQARTLKIPIQPGTEVEIAQMAVEAGEYTKIKVYLTDDNYVTFSTDPGTFHQLYFEQDDEDDEDEIDASGDKGHRFKIKHFKPVIVREGYLTTIYLDVEANELVEYEDDENEYLIDPEAKYVGSILTPILSGSTRNDLQGK
ncbi:MAG: DUF4382 domain-containing protein [Leptospirales bacterium]